MDWAADFTEKATSSYHCDLFFSCLPRRSGFELQGNNFSDELELHSETVVKHSLTVVAGLEQRRLSHFLLFTQEVTCTVGEGREGVRRKPNTNTR